MSNFARAVLLCLRRPWTLGIAFACSLLVAGFWGANIGTVYPLMEVLFRGRSLPEWVDEEIAACHRDINQANREIGDLEAALTVASPERRAEIQAELARIRDRRSAEQRALQLRQRLQPLTRWMPRRAFATLFFLMAFLLVGTILKCALLMVNSLLVERAVQLSLMDVRRRFFENALRLDLGSLGKTSSSELTSRFAYDMETLTVALRNLFARATVEPLKMIVCISWAGLLSWRLLLVSLVLVPLAGVLIERLSKSIKRANRRGMEEMSRLVGQLSESIEAVQIIKAFAMENYERLRFAERTRAFYRKSLKITFYNALTKPISELFGVGAVSLALLAGGYLVLAGQTHLLGLPITDRPLTPEAFFAFFALLAGAADPARKLADIYSQIQPGSPAADRLFDIIDRAPAIQDPPHPKQLPQPHGSLAFDNVSFCYHAGQPVLSDITLEIPYGQSLAIVGVNGCGKSTLTSLVPRFYDPTEGSVRIDGIDLRQLGLAELRGRIGLVSQQAQLFDDTVANNIRYGSLDATEQQVCNAARGAHAHEFIMEKLDNGYDTLVGARGSKLSGGQRQRIVLARAILRDPEILILDEATSQIDIESEHLIHAALQQFIQGRTAIMITHRLSTLALADRILVMEAGRILDLGTHEQLLARCGAYQRLHTIEMRKSA